MSAMTTSANVKMVICGVALVSLASVRAASAQAPGSCNSSGSSEGISIQSEDCSDSDFHTFAAGGDTERFDFDFGSGNTQISLQITANVTSACGVTVEAEQVTPAQFATKTDSSFPAAACIPIM